MGVTYARGSITGKTEIREYDFLVDTGATWVGIPQEDIDALALDAVPNATAALMTAGTGPWCGHRYTWPLACWRARAS